MERMYRPVDLTPDTPVPELFTLLAQQNPHRPFVQIIREHLDAPTDSIRLTCADVIRHAQNAAADLRARWAESQKDEDTKKRFAQPRVPGSPPVVVGVLSKNGYELYANILACALNRWTAVLISPRNSPAGVEHLLRTSNASLFLVEADQLEFGRTLEQAIPGMVAQLVASLDASPASSPLTSLTQEQLKDEMELPAFYLHTSGSTGHPKLIAWSHKFILSGSRARRKESDEWNGLPLYTVSPLIHGTGVMAYLMFAPAHANLINFVESPTPKPPSGASLLEYIPFIKGGIVILPPSVMEEVYRLGTEAIQKVVDGLRMVFIGGAPLKTETGNALVAAGMKLTTAYGSTEIGIGTTARLTHNPEHWEYLYFREGYNWHFLPIDDHSNLRELIVGPGTEDCPTVIDHENPRGFATHDVWEPHPTIPNLWKHHSRKGDVTVLSTGEKSNNKQIEDLLLQDSRILYVLVFGAGRLSSGVILQPVNPSITASDFLLHIQPTIDRANSILPKHSRLIPELIIVAAPDKPFATTDKGTVKRKETLDQYQQEVRSAYGALEEGAEGADWAFEGDMSDEDDLKRFVRTVVHRVLHKEVPDEGDLFEHGFDSLLSMRLRAAVLSVTRRTSTPTQPVPLNVVYTFPTINSLTSYLLSRAAPGTSELQQATETRIRQSVAKYSTDFVPHTPGARVVHDKIIALSGSTGSAGTLILGHLLARDDIKRIYLLNRRGTESQESRQASGFKGRGLDPKLLDANKENIVYLDVDFSRKDLGLAEEDYQDLRYNVTHIIHAAWHLNFNLILESYERVHVAGVRNLADLALSSPHAQPPRFTFLSSVAAVAMYAGPTQEPSTGERAGQMLVPETPIDDPSIPLDQGYAHSKYVGERVLVNAVDAGLRVTIVRVGQLCGTTTNGAWTMSEHVPIMLRSSLALGVVPDDLPPVRWIPSDIAASAIVKQALKEASTLEYFSVENPFLTQWKAIVQALSAVAPKPLRRITLAAWLEYIRKANPDPKEVPATKLLDFYRKNAQGRQPTSALGWEKSVQHAPELQVGSITSELITKFVLYQKENLGKL